jgi:hypothetical protein
MTDDRTALVELLQKSDDGDIQRGKRCFCATGVMAQ